MREAMTKLEARALLVGRYGRANALWLLSGLILCVPNLLVPSLRWALSMPAVQTALPSPAASLLLLVAALLALAAATLLCAPLKAGRMAWFWRQNANLGKGNGLGALFAPFRPARRAMQCAALWLRLFVRKLGWWLLFCAPGMILLGISWFQLTAGSELSTFLILCAAGGIFLVVGLFFYLLVTRRYLLVYYLFDELDRPHAAAIIRESARVMDGQMGQAAVFALSFTPWILSCILLFPALYVYPYYQQSRATFARQVFNRAPHPLAQDAEI